MQRGEKRGKKKKEKKKKNKKKEGNLTLLSGFAPVALASAIFLVLGLDVAGKCFLLKKTLSKRPKKTAARSNHPPCDRSFQT
jgi:hypothetical protein